jgi:hypothetical protein
LPAEVYVEHKAPPHARGLDNDVWVTKVECRACAGRLGRLSDSPPEDFMVPLFEDPAIA